MGCFIAPFVLGAFAILVFAIITSYKLLTSGTIGLLEIGIGIMLSMALFGVIVLSYVVKGEQWGLDSYFRFPICMVIIPFLIYILITNISFLKFEYASNLLLVSIAATGILTIAYNYLFPKLMGYFKIKIWY